MRIKMRLHLLEWELVPIYGEGFLRWLCFEFQVSRRWKGFPPGQEVAFGEGEEEGEEE